MTLPVLAESYLHTLDPFAIRFTESFGVRWYGVAYAAGFIIAWLGLQWAARTRRIQLTPVQASDIMFAGILGVLVGGRFGYILFYNPELLWTFRDSIPFWNALAIHDGGMSAHGGMLGVIIAISWYALRNSVSKLHLLDISAVLSSPGLCLGRVANFVNGELPGRPVPQDMQGPDAPWWSIKYPEDVLTWHPQRDADRFAEFLPHLPPTESPAQAILRAVDDGNQQVINLLHQTLTAHYPSQLIQAATDGPLLLFPLVLIWLKARKPGVVGGWYLIIYGVLRILSEQWRTPDEGVALLAGLSRGQVLSVFMVAVGAVGLTIVARRDVQPIGGLLRPQNIPPVSATDDDT